MFGGLQATNILCSVVRAKLVALWIGPAGIGLFGLLNSALETINSLSQLGIRQSAVADIASAPRQRIPALVATVRRWCLFLGLSGALFTLICAGWLSQLSFGNDGYRWAFSWLAITVFLSVCNNGEGAVFQGLQRFRKLAVCSMIGSLGGLAVSVPMFYFWRIDSIVPSIIAYSVVTWIAMGLYREKVPRCDEQLSLDATIKIGRRFLTLGLYLTVTAIATNLINYAFLAYLNIDTNIDATGYYNAGFTLVNRYAGLVFTAISMEYFPRLSAVAHSAKRTGLFVSNQLYIALAIIVPVATLFIACSAIVVRLLYTADFTVMLPFVIWAMPGTVLRAVSWCMAFVILARSDGKTFLITELLSCAVSITLSIVGYRLWGYAGIGYAYFAWYAIYTILVAIPYFFRYRLSIDRRLPLFTLYCIGITCAASLLALNLTPMAALPVAAAAALISFRLLRRLL